MSGIYRILFYKLYLRVPLSEIPVDFEVYGLSVFGTEVEKKLMGDDDDGLGTDRKHRFSVSHSVTGQIIYTDDWIDAKGHVHHDALKQPLLQHFAADILQLQDDVAALKLNGGGGGGVVPNVVVDGNGQVVDKLPEPPLHKNSPAAANDPVPSLIAAPAASKSGKKPDFDFASGVPATTSAASAAGGSSACQPGKQLPDFDFEGAGQPNKVAK